MNELFEINEERSLKCTAKHAIDSDIKTVNLHITADKEKISIIETCDVCFMGVETVINRIDMTSSSNMFQDWEGYGGILRLNLSDGHSPEYTEQIPFYSVIAALEENELERTIDNIIGDRRNKELGEIPLFVSRVDINGELIIEKHPLIFISGHLDLTSEEFALHYKPQIDHYLCYQPRFIIGDARGADSMAQEYLNSMDYTNVTIYHMFTSPRNNIGNYPTVGGFKTDSERDEAMTEASDIDIAWIRPGREKSGTAENLARRKRKNYGA